MIGLQRVKESQNEVSLVKRVSASPGKGIGSRTELFIVDHHRQMSQIAIEVEKKGRWSRIQKKKSSQKLTSSHGQRKKIKICWNDDETKENHSR